MNTYSINCNDREATPAWATHCEVLTPGNQDSGRVRYAARVADEDVEALEAALEADSDVLEYERTSSAARVERAAEHLSAADVGSGNWAYYADEMSRWYVIDADELEELCDYLDCSDEQVRRDAYSHWCAGTTAREMPSGWEPGDEI